MNKLLRENKIYEPTPLIATKLYTTFQICCCIKSSNNRLSLENVFNKVILYIMDWFRSRINKGGNDSSITDPICFYKPHEDYASFDISNVDDVTIRDSFTMNTLYLDDLKNWSFRLSELDNKSEFENSTKEYIKDRSFITNIAVKQEDDHIILSYKCACKEPVTNTLGDCAVYRPQFLKTLCADEDFVISEFPDTEPDYDKISNHPICIEQNSVCKNVANTLIKNEDRMLPVMLFTSDSSERESIDIPRLASSLVGFCHIFIVAQEQFKRLFRANLSNAEVEPGDIVIYEKGDHYRIYKADPQNDAYRSCDDNSGTEMPKVNTPSTYYALRDDMRSYPVRKAYCYRSSLFYREAQIKKYERINTTDPVILKEEISELNQKIDFQNTKIRQLEADSDSQQCQLRDTKRALKESELSLDVEKRKLERATYTIESLQTDIDLKNEKLNSYGFLLRLINCVPGKKDAVCDWIDNYFSDYLVIHPRARKNLDKYRGNLDVQLLCYGFIYLYAYKRYKKGEITSDVLELFKCGKPWECTLCGNNNINRFDEYTIDLADLGIASKKGKLDYHVKYGVDSEHLIRIYFTDNNDLDKIIIGDMPEHLPTTSTVH